MNKKKNLNQSNLENTEKLDDFELEMEPNDINLQTLRFLKLRGKR